ncbi:MAG: hypothetical protein OEM91_05020 [Hyphomicrobiales bacterium]|nr:hypothetical protein [Hyphomicrobiales bacterium]
MALDTTVGGTDADSYGSLVEFKAYADDIGFVWGGSPPAYSDGELEIGLRKGAQYLDRGYRGRWKGFRTDRDQALAWPRTGDADNAPSNYLTASYTVGIIDEDGYEIATNVIPDRLKEAQFEATIINLPGTDLLPVLDRGGSVELERVKAGPVETETKYGSAASSRDRALKIEGLLTGLVNSHPGGGMTSGRIVRG